MLPGSSAVHMVFFSWLHLGKLMEGWGWVVLSFLFVCCLVFSLCTSPSMVIQWLLFLQIHFAVAITIDIILYDV